MKQTIKRGIVKTVTNGIQISRYGRGYSKDELVQSGVTDIRVARKNNIPIDPFRTTGYEENIEQLKSFLGQEISKTKRNTKKGENNSKQNS
ncbi:MAG TPA: hypothetical protein VJ599_05170 [Nitrososphaeraceae archaeon]|nr:hypothetical protein [Nitrososphaeraceae archaeon]